MAEIIAIANQKGGVGKTTTAINLSAALACLGQDTLLVDLDPQGNASSGLGFNNNGVEVGIYEAIIENAPIEKAIIATNLEKLDLVRSSPDMIGAELALVDLFSRENRLKNSLSAFSGAYSFMVIDCPPSLGILTINALSAANSVIIPIQGEYYALEGLAQFIKAIEKIRSAINRDLKIEGGVLTMFDPRYTLSQQVRSELLKYFGNSLFKTAIPRSIRLAEAPSFGKSIFQYDARSKGSEAYIALAGELLAKRGWHGVRMPDAIGRGDGYD